MSRPKELNFFLGLRSWSKGFDWYRRHFRADAPVRGESSPNYTLLPFSEGTAERMHEHIPEAKLIYMVRDPLERIVSHYIHARGLGQEERPFAVAAADFEDRYVARSRYWTQLEPFVLQFGSDAIRVETQEDLLAEREATIRRVYTFLGVDDAFTSPQFERLWERSAGKDRKYRLALRTSRRLGGGIWARMPARIRWTLERVTYAPVAGGVERPEIPEQLRERLVELLAPEVAQLEDFTGRSFDAWSVRP
jgi:hypothetical protein